MVGELVNGRGLVVRYAVADPSLTISPGGGKPGSFSWRFMRTVERRRPGYEGCRFRGAELLEEPDQNLLAE